LQASIPRRIGPRIAVRSDPQSVGRQADCAISEDIGLAIDVAAAPVLPISRLPEAALARSINIAN